MDLEEGTITVRRSYDHDTTKGGHADVLPIAQQLQPFLEEAIDAATRDRDEAARLLADQQAQIEGARGESQKIIAEARAIAEKLRADTLEKTRQEQQEMLARARRDLAAEHEKAIAQLRREAVDLAIAGASKVVEENLDSDKNRKIVETFLASLAAESSKPKAESR